MSYSVSRLREYYFVFFSLSFFQLLPESSRQKEHVGFFYRIFCKSSAGISFKNLEGSRGVVLPYMVRS